MADTDLKVCILVPVLDRPANVAPLLASIEAATPEPHRVVFIATDGDTAEISALRTAGAEHATLGEPGTYARKINYGCRMTVEPLLFSAADDLRFHPGWLPAALLMLTPGVEVVGTNDLGNARTVTGLHSTHTLFTRRYIDTVGGVIDGPPGVVLCELYPHDGCDDEFVRTARHRGVYAHAPDSYVEHLHPSFGKSADDATYRLGWSHGARGRELLAERHHLWT